MNNVLLTVSGVIPPDIETKILNKERPNVDYVAMAKAFQADLIDYALAKKITGWVGRLLDWIGGPNLTLAWACFLLRKKYKLIFTDGEQIGIPLAAAFKFLTFGHRPKHFMIGHILSVHKKEMFFDFFRVHTAIDHFFVYSTYQKKYIEDRWNVSPEKVVYTPFMVDHHFFHKDAIAQGDSLSFLDTNMPIICSVGLEFRDYPTLVEAVRGLPIKVVIAAGSPWSKRKSSVNESSDIPDNIIVQRFSLFDLRILYAMSRFVVMPLYPVDFQAGITTILEAMAMSKAIICSRTPGQTDVIKDGQNGIYVSPQNPEELRCAIQDLLNQPEKAQQLGTSARALIDDCINLDHYCIFLNKFIQEQIQEH
jgi:glycosyltransferase involved in cell wall biosynthesis